MQVYVSKSLVGLDFKSKYGLSDYTDSLMPLVMFGMYRKEDIALYLKHKGDLILVWQGMDSKDLKWIKEIKSRKAKHYSISHWIMDSLDSYGIENEFVPISATIGKLNYHPKGDCVYLYSSNGSKGSADYYGEQMIDEIRTKTGLEIIRGAYGIYRKDEMEEIYKKCFINLRLTQYDGCPNTNLEMGMMGRKSVFNGMIPNSIRWYGVDDICESIMMEYDVRKSDSLEVAQSCFEFTIKPDNIFNQIPHTL